MIEGKTIQALLNDGYTVKSQAIGRMGTVLSVSGNFVTLKLVRGRGTTSFIGGDKVELFVDKKKKIALIRHPDSIWNALERL